MSQILHNKKFRSCLECIPHGKLDLYINILDKNRKKKEQRNKIRYPIWIWIMIKGFMLDYKKYHKYILNKSLKTIEKQRHYEVTYEGAHNPRIVSGPVVRKYVSLCGRRREEEKTRLRSNGYMEDRRSTRVIEYNGGFVGVYDTRINKFLSKYKFKNKRRSIVVNAIDNDYLKRRLFRYSDHRNRKHYIWNKNQIELMYFIIQNTERNINYIKNY